MKKYCIHLLEKLGSFKYTRDILKKLDEEARAEVIININAIACLIFNKKKLIFRHRILKGYRSRAKRIHGRPFGRTIYME